MDWDISPNKSKKVLSLWFFPPCIETIEIKELWFYLGEKKSTDYIYHTWGGKEKSHILKVHLRKKREEIRKEAQWVKEINWTSFGLY